MHLLTLFFVIDGSHTKKRILAFKKNVDNLTIVSYYREKNIEYDNHHNLGKSPQKQYLRRFIKIIFDVPRLLGILRKNPDVQVVYAWNFDIALLFRLARLFSRRKYTFIYEVADIKPILLSDSIIGKSLRRLEQFVLNKTDYLCVTSRDYIENYFDKFYDYKGKTHLLENKVFPPIDTIISDEIDHSNRNRKWRIGLVGLIRCNVSLNLLYDIATELPDQVEIVLAGKPEDFALDAFNKLAGLENTKYFGEYKYPGDLQNVYSNIDIIWSADFSDLSVNSKWLLPNRIYEAGLFSVPQLCFSENVAICRYIESLDIGWILKDASKEILKKFIIDLTRSNFDKIKQNYKNLPSNQFSGDDQIITLLSQISDNTKVS